jgi:hypothetical protein
MARERLQAVAFRLSPKLAERLRSFLRDNAGKPHFVKPCSFGESAIERELDRLESEFEQDEPEPQGVTVRRINAVHVPEPRRTT